MRTRAASPPDKEELFFRRTCAKIFRGRLFPLAALRINACKTVDEFGLNVYNC